MSDLDNKENTEPSFDNIKINIDKLDDSGENLYKSLVELELDEKNTESSLYTQPPQIEELAKIEPKPVKIDRRKISSRLNIEKARQAKAKKRAEQQARLKQLFGDSDSESGDTETGSDTESEEETYLSKYHKHKYKQLYSQTRKELNEMKTLIYKLAEKNKKARRKQRKNRKKEKESVRSLTSDEAENSPEERDTRRNVSQPAPVVNVYTTQPETKQEGGNSLFRQMLKRRLTNR